MSKARVKVTVKTGRKGGAGTLIARVPVAVKRTDQPEGKRLFETQAQLNIHPNRGQRPSKFRYRGAN